MHKQFILAIISYFVLTMLMAYPWHVIWFHDLYVELGATTREHPIMPFGMLSILMQGAVIAYLYPIYYRSKTGSPSPLITGITFSLIMGMMVYSVMVFTTAAKFHIEPVQTFLLYGSVFQLIQYIVTGAALGFIYGHCKTGSLE